MTAGKRRDLITFSRLGGGQDASGQELGDNWANLGSEWAEVKYGSGEERRQAATQQGNQAAVFIVLDNDLMRTIKTKDRINHDDAFWDITAIAPIESRGEREFTGVRAS